MSEHIHYEGVRAYSCSDPACHSEDNLNRLERLAQMYEDDYGVDVREVEGGGAAGGLAGGLVAAGARLVPGFDLVADELDLHDRLEGADLVVTGEGFLDEHSFDGKAVEGSSDLDPRRPVGDPVLGDPSRHALHVHLNDRGQCGRSHLCVEHRATQPVIGH